MAIKSCKNCLYSTQSHSICLGMSTGACKLWTYELQAGISVEVHHEDFKLEFEGLKTSIYVTGKIVDVSFESEPVKVRLDCNQKVYDVSKEFINVLR